MGDENDGAVTVIPPKGPQQKREMVVKKKTAPDLDLDSLLTTACKGKTGEDESFSAVTMIDLMATPEVFGTGIEQLDRMLGGGFHWGRMAELFGPNKSGKTELARFISASILEADPDVEVWYFDQEFALNPAILHKYPSLSLRNAAGKLRFRPISVSSLEEYFKLMYKALRMLGTINEKAIKEGTPTKKIVFVLDSVPALKANASVENEEFEKSSLLPEPRIWSDQTSKLRQYLAHVGAFAIMVNQIRDKPGTPSYVDPESPGGQALKFYADYRLYLRTSSKFSFSKGRSVPTRKRSSGFFSKITVRKNKTGLPDREMEMVITFTDALGKKSGISPEWTLFYSLLDAKIIKSAGGKFRIAGLEEGFTRLDWVNLCDDLLKVDGSALRVALDTWVERQLSNDSGSAGGGEEEDE